MPFASYAGSYSIGVPYASIKEVKEFPTEAEASPEEVLVLEAPVSEPESVPADASEEVLSAEVDPSEAVPSVVVPSAAAVPAASVPEAPAAGVTVGAGVAVGAGV